ncbi:uncharacterized protein LOC144412091 isoform X2 [Styela clava]
MSDSEPGEYKNNHRSSGERSRSRSVHSKHSSPEVKKRSYSRSRSRSYRSRSRSYRSRSRSYNKRSRSRSPRRRSRSYEKRSRSYSPRRRRSRSRSTRKSRSPMSDRKRHIGDRMNPPTGRCLGVFGLSLYTTESDLSDVFSRYGRIDKCNIVIDQKSGRSRGFGFVYFDSGVDAEEAKDRANGMELDGRRIRVDFSITKRAHTPTPGVYVGRPTHTGPPPRRPHHNDRYSNDRYGGGRDHRDDYRGRDHRRRSPSPYYRRRSPSPYRDRSPYRSRY